MHLELLSPPVLVSVDEEGVLHPALLLAARADRRYVQVSHGAGRNHLRWVDAAAVGTSPAPVTASNGGPSTAPARGLPRRLR